MWQSSSISLWGVEVELFVYQCTSLPMGNGTIPHWALGINLGFPQFVCGSWVVRLCICSSSGSDQTQLSRLFSQLWPPVGKSFTPRSSFHCWNQTFPIHEIPRFTMTLTVPSDLTVILRLRQILMRMRQSSLNSTASFHLLFLDRIPGLEWEQKMRESKWMVSENGDQMGIQTVGFCLVQTPWFGFWEDTAMWGKGVIQEHHRAHQL